MADKKTEIVYTPEELSEIDRIIGVVTGEPAQPDDTVSAPPEQGESIDSVTNDGFDDSDDYDIEEKGETLPDEISVDLDDDFDDSMFTEDEPAAIDTSEISEFEDLDDIDSSFDEEAAPADDEVLPLADEDISFIDDEALPPFEDEALDITDDRAAEDFDSLEDIEEFSDLDMDDIPASSADELAIDGDDIPDIPDLDSLDIDDSAEIPETDEIDLPDIDFDDLDKSEISADIEESPEVTAEDTDSFDDIDISADTSDISPLDDLDSFSDDAFDDLPDISDDLDDFDDQSAVSLDADDMLDDIESAAPEHIDDDILTIEPLDEDEIIGDDVYESEPQASGKSGADVPLQEIELSAKDLARLKKAMLIFNPSVRDAIKDTVINDRIPATDMRRLIDMILTGKPEENIHKFLEKKLKRKIIPVDEAGVPGRKIITSRPEYTMEGRERQKRLLRITKIFSATALSAFFITILSYQYVYKPYMAKKLINNGVQIIVQSGLTGGRFERRTRYDEAEKIFDLVERDYVKDYLYGYNEYARAYLENLDYKESLDKLNKAYVIDRTDTKTLNNLGYFYARVDQEYFNSVRGNIAAWYFAGREDAASVKSSLDLAINFYRRTLLVDEKNVTAMLGIGNAYFYQGQFLQAKKYYEDILRVDKNSVIGYSGLLNLYIERDSFPMVATLHAEIRGKKMLSDLPSPLLSKLAGYYLDKRAKDDSNIRIDYGVTSPRLMDKSDNTYPAVLEVLKALNNRDPDYPQLQIQYARFHLAQKNLTLMKRYLEKALSMSPDYFSALHLTGVYHYSTREPVKAYRYLKRAADVYGNQPAFTKEDFYRETEQIGETNTYLGHIFYYYFDRVKSRKGALDDEMIDDSVEKLANYSIAEQYYITASNRNYNSPELNYNLGRIYYLKKNYTMALDRWLHLYDSTVSSPEIMMSIGNAFYHNGNYESAKGEFLKLASVLEYEADKIRVTDSSKQSHLKIFQTLSSAYNNLGAVYQNLDDAPKRDLAYWKSIDFMKRLDRENEYARVNMARSHRNAEPMLDENIPFSIDIFSEEMRGW